MANWDVDDLIVRCKRMAKRPAVDEEMQPSDWAALLTEAQGHWMPVFATHVPESQYGPPVELVVSEDRKTASFPEGVVPMGKVVLRDGLGGRRLLPNEDFLIEGSLIRAPLDRTFSFSAGVWARYVDIGDLEIRVAEDGVDAKQPKLEPPNARILLVYNALAKWAAMGGYRDPSYFEHLEIKEAWDDPATGKPGIITSPKSQYADQEGGSAATPWWRSSDLGNLRHRLV